MWLIANGFKTIGTKVNKMSSKYIFLKSSKANKKYMVSVDGKVVHFGAIKDGVPMSQYRDSTGLGLYSKYDHNDKERRDRYRARHRAIKLKDGTPAYKKKYSPAWFSYNFLW